MKIEILDRYQRMQLSEPTRILLLHFAAGDEGRSLPKVRGNWAEVLEATSRHGLVPLAARLLKQQATDDYPPQSFVAEMQRRYQMTTVRTMLMYRRIADLLQALTRNRLEFIVLKGPALGSTVYPDTSLRIFNDLDLLVRERDWGPTNRMLKALEFIPEQDRSEHPPKLVPQAVLYEQKYYHGRDGFLVEVHYDDILNAGLAARNIKGFWQRAVVTHIEGVPAKVLCPEDQIIHLCAHVHAHGYARLNWLADLAFIFRRRSGHINWQQLIATVRQEDAKVPVYYSLHFLDRLLRVPVPPEILPSIKPDPFRRWAHNVFLPEDKVLSLQPMPHPILSFYFRPFLKRLLPDLFVMGRRPEKFRYLLRLLLPPRDWLTDHYSLGPSDNILVHYLLHPLKFFYHIAADLFTAGTRTVLKALRRVG
jgi:hypothetical protein